MSRIDQPVHWEDSDDARLPYQAKVGGARWQVRVNEFPEEPYLYSLLVDGEAVEHLMAWPDAWTRSQDHDDPHERGAYAHELAKLEHQRGVPPSALVREVSTVDELFAAAEAADAAAVAEAVRAAAASGKEPFSMSRIAALLGAAPEVLRYTEHELELKYYVLEPELRTLAELAAFLRKVEAWD